MTILAGVHSSYSAEDPSEGWLSSDRYGSRNYLCTTLNCKTVLKISKDMQKIYNIFADILPYSHYSRRNTLDRRIETGQEIFTHQYSDSEDKDQGALV